MRVAVIDIGSNSIRLVIYNVIKKTEKEILYNEKEFALLRSDYDTKNCLTRKGIEVLLSTLGRFKEVIGVHEVEDVLVFATASLRGASNRQVILEEVEAKLNLKIHLFSEQEEAFYGYYSVINALPYQEAVTADLGGGSMELTYFKNKKLVNQISLPYGTIALKEMAYEDEYINLEAVSDYVYRSIKELFWIKDTYIPLILTGGSARNMIKIHRSFNNLDKKLHDYQIKRGEMTQVKVKLLDYDFEAIKGIKGFSAGRETMIVPAIEAFDTLATFSRASQVILSKEGIREGVLYHHIKDK